jgi:hypothetical protein
MLRKGVTDAWVSWTHAEHAMTKTLERRFSAGSSGVRARQCYTEVEIAVAARFGETV